MIKVDALIAEDKDLKKQVKTEGFLTIVVISSTYIFLGLRFFYFIFKYTPNILFVSHAIPFPSTMQMI